MAVVNSGQAESSRSAAVVTIQAEAAAMRSIGGTDGPGWNLWSNGHIAENVPFSNSERHRITARARGNSATTQGPMMEVRIDGRTVATTEVHVSRNWEFEDYSFIVVADPGSHEVTIAHVDDPNRPGHNVDLIVDRFTVAPADGDIDAPGSRPSTTVPRQPRRSTLTSPEPKPPTMPTTTAPSTTVPSQTVPATPAPTGTPPSPTMATTAAPPTSPSSGGGRRSPYVPAGYQLAWNDEFNSLSLDLEGDGGENWGTFFNGWNVLSLAGNGDQCMKADPSYTGTGGPPLGIETHRVRNGVLSLYGHPIPDSRRGQFWNYQAACGMISGQNSHAQTYGYWEARMRIPTVSTGHHWAIWLLPENNTWPPEVDILEVVGLDPSKFHFTGHYNNASGNKQADLAYRQAPGAADDWYTLGLEWTRDSVVWYLDGVEVHRMRNFIGSAPNYFLISPEIGGNWPGPTNGSTRWPMSMEIDYVRIYNK